MSYIHRRYTSQFLRRLTEKDTLSSSVMKACSSIITNERLDVSYSVYMISILNYVFTVVFYAMR
jgi:hypothetical protein